MAEDDGLSEFEFHSSDTDIESDDDKCDKMVVSMPPPPLGLFSDAALRGYIPSSPMNRQSSGSSSSSICRSRSSSLSKSPSHLRVEVDQEQFQQMDDRLMIFFIVR